MKSRRHYLCSGDGRFTRYKSISFLGRVESAENGVQNLVVCGVAQETNVASHLARMPLFYRLSSSCPFLDSSLNYVILCSAKGVVLTRTAHNINTIRSTSLIA